MELKNNQSAIILEASADGEITVDIASSDIDGLSGRICVAVAKKITGDAKFQTEIMDIVEEDIQYQTLETMEPHIGPIDHETMKMVVSCPQ
jgi:hypothetical protein